MKKITTFGLLVLLLLVACSNDKKESLDVSSLLLLEIDYKTNTFVGGKEYTYSENAYVDTVPVRASYIPLDVAGELTVSYLPFESYQAVDTIIFKGEVKWQHTGAMVLPKAITPASSFTTTNAVNTTPGASQFQAIFIDESFRPSSYTPIWNAISNLSKIKEYYDPNVKIGIFLYTPGIGFPFSEDNPHQNDWRWFIVMYKH